MKQSHASHHVFHTLRNWLMMVPMRLAHPANHQRMTEEMPSKATLGEFYWSVKKIRDMICDKKTRHLFVFVFEVEQDSFLLKVSLFRKDLLVS